MNKIKAFLFLVVLLASAALPSFAQTTTTTTTLTAAVTTPSVNVPRLSNFTITVASNTGITGTNQATSTTPASGLYIDNEYFLVRSTSGTTQVTVTGGQAGTASVTHASGAIVWIGPAGASGPFLSGSGNNRPTFGGSCTSANYLFLPLINVLSGSIYNCVGSLWTSYTPVAPASNGNVWARRTITASYTAVATDFEIVNTTTTANTTVAVTLPCATVPAGKNWIISDEGGSAGTGGFGISIIGALSSTQQILTGFTSRGYYSNGTSCFRTF